VSVGIAVIAGLPDLILAKRATAAGNGERHNHAVAALKAVHILDERKFTCHFCEPPLAFRGVLATFPETCLGGAMQIRMQEKEQA
jgi:hypothetical protein